MIDMLRKLRFKDGYFVATLWSRITDSCCYSSILIGKKTLVETWLSGFQVTANKKNVETRKDKHLMEQYFWNVKMLISRQRATWANISASPENVVRFVTVFLFCMTFWQRTGEQISKNDWFFFSFLHFFLFFFANHHFYAIWCSPKPRSYVSYSCSVVIQHSPYSTACFLASLRMHRIRQPSKTFSGWGVRACKLVALLDWPTDCLQLVRLLACIVTVANVRAGQKWNFYFLPFATIFTSSNAFKQFLFP